MVKSYISIAFRYMIRHKGFSFINIVGLTIGIACSLLIVIYIHDELSYDTFHRDAHQIYRISFKGSLQGKKIQSAYTGSQLANTLQQESALIKSTLRLANWATFPMRYKDRTFTEPNLLLADSNFFHFFNFNLLEGDPLSVLNKEKKIVITESAARRYFDYKGPGDKTPLGKVMTLAQGYTATISGIAQDPPLNSHFHFTFILSMDSWDESKTSGWITGKVITYINLKPNQKQKAVEEKLKVLARQHLHPELEQLSRTNVAQFKNQGNDLGFFVQPLLSIHLHSKLTDEMETNGDIQYIYLFGAIAAFITLLACINFMNLSTARSASRAKEVGVRKAVGAPNARLIKQFLIESYFYIFIAVLLSLFAIMIVLGPFNVFTHKQLSISSLFSPTFLAGMPVFVLAVGALAGSYPAFYLTSFTPVEIFRGKIRSRLRNYGIRNVLVVFQFFISTGLIIATLVVYQQLQYIHKIDVGFDKENIVNLLHTANLGKNGDAFKKELLQHNEIIGASYSNRLPPNIDRQYVFSTPDSSKDYMLTVYEMDYDHLSTMKFKMVSGRFFSPEFPTDSTTVILNQTAIEKLGMTGGFKKLFSIYGEENGMEREVIGVIQDFNFQSLKNPIQPLAIVLGRQPNWEMAIRIKGENTSQTIDLIKSLWKKYAPDAPFEYTLLADNFEGQHQTEKRIGLLFIVFTVLAIFIACLGLVGLANFIADQRTKEIGVRKALGATENNIIIILNKDFLKLVLIANLIAWPITWWLMSMWLHQFAYHTTMHWWTFVLAGTITLLIAFFSVSFRAIKAARGNPVNSLRTE